MRYMEDVLVHTIPHKTRGEVYARGFEWEANLNLKRWAQRRADTGRSRAMVPVMAVNDSEAKHSQCDFEQR